MPRSAKSIIANLLLLVGSIVVVLAGAEVFLRVFPRFLPPMARLKVRWSQPGGPTAHRDPYIGFLMPAHAHERDGGAEASYVYSTDEHGFRNKSPWPDSASIVFIGDSMVFGYGVSDDAVWTRSVCRQVGDGATINLGVPGMAPKQYLRVYERFGIALHPKLLVLGLFTGNDLQDEKAFDEWLQAGTPGNFAVWKFSHGARPGLVRRVEERSYLYWFVQETAAGAQRRLQTRSRTFADGGRIDFIPSRLALPASLAKPENPSFREVMRSIEEAQALAKRNGTAFLVVLFPTKEEVYLPLEGDSVPQIRPVFLQALDSQRIPYLDLTVPLQDAARRGERLFFQVDGHPNAHGYEVIADAVAAQIREHAEEYHIPARD